MRYILSGLYVENKDIDKAAKQLETLIKRNPDNATYKNDLGFIWCDNDMKLEESEKLIKEAIELDKKEQEKAKEEGKLDEVKPNAAYLDSLGWVLFKQKKYKEALEHLKKASPDEEEGSHLEIWDHLADCYMALGQKKDAIAAWEKGAEDGRPLEARRRTPPQGEREAQEGPQVGQGRVSPRTFIRIGAHGHRGDHPWAFVLRRGALHHARRLDPHRYRRPSGRCVRPARATPLRRALAPRSKPDPRPRCSTAWRWNFRPGGCGALRPSGAVVVGGSCLAGVRPRPNPRAVLARSRRALDGIDLEDRPPGRGRCGRRDGRAGGGAAGTPASRTVPDRRESRWRVRLPRAPRPRHAAR